MSIKMRSYDPGRDFGRIRDFLSETYALFGRPLNWRIERWNYARYFVAPMLGMYGKPADCVAEGRAAIALWEELLAVWETEAGQIAGVVNIEHPDRDHPGYGEFFVQRHPDCGGLLPEMLAFAEAHMAHPETGRLFVYVYEYDELLQGVLRERGYSQHAEDCGYDAVRPLSPPDLPPPDLPDGFALRSMADANDIERRREVFGRSFNHEHPLEWPSAFAYRELQRAPDYRPELDVVVVAPDGRFAACCITWYDAHNRLAALEPVGTIPAFRRLGLGREVVLEGLRRAAQLGAQSVQVGSGQRFYEKLGFEKRYRVQRWER